jgi:hypothetical protein
LVLQAENLLLRHQILPKFADALCSDKWQVQKTVTHTMVEQTVNQKKWLRTTSCARPCTWCHF